MIGPGPVGAEASRLPNPGSGRAPAGLETSRGFCSIEDSMLLALAGGSGASVAAPSCPSILGVSSST